MRPEEIKHLFQGLKAEAKAGTISEDDFEAQLRAFFLFRDDSGAYWTIGAQTQTWYRREGGDWVQASPPSNLERAEPEGDVPIVDLPQALSAERRRLDTRVLVGLVSLCFLICLVLATAISYQLGRMSVMTGPAVQSPSPAVDVLESPTPEEAVLPSATAVAPLPTGEGSPSPEATATPAAPTSTPRPAPTATATVLPAPPRKYGPPVLLGPEDGALFGHGYEAQLEWRPVEGLREGEYYHVEACWNECETAGEFHGHYTGEAKYQFPGWIYRGRAIDEKYYWHVTVRAQQGAQPAGPADPAISEESEIRWKL